MKLPPFDHLKLPCLTVGNFTYAGPNFEILHTDLNSMRVTIGNFCSIAGDVKIIAGGGHPTNYVTTSPFFYAPYFPGFKVPKPPDHELGRGGVKIGSDVWIGHGAILLSGASIGHGAIVAAGAVVAGIVEPYSIVGGVPARHIRYRFDSKTISDLLEIAWWNWPLETIRANARLLYSADMAEFIARHRVS